MSNATHQPETLTALYRRVTAKPCPRCNGTRRYTVMEPKVWGSGESRVVLHGHLVPKCYVCDRCNGTGKAA